MKIYNIITLGIYIWKFLDIFYILHFYYLLYLAP